MDNRPTDPGVTLSDEEEKLLMETSPSESGAPSGTTPPEEELAPAHPLVSSTTDKEPPTDSDVTQSIASQQDAQPITEQLGLVTRLSTKITRNDRQLPGTHTIGRSSPEKV